MSPASSLDPKLFDETVAAVALFAGPEHRLVYQNAACCGMLGARPLGLPAREAFSEPDAAEFMTVLDDVVATGRPRQILESREPDPGAAEQARYFVYSCTPVTLPDGPGAMVVAMDTTAETMALQRYEALVSAVSQMVWVVRADGSAEEVVPGWQELTGSPWNGWMDEDWYAHIHPRDREGLGRAWHAAADQEPPGVMEPRSGCGPPTAPIAMCRPAACPSCVTATPRSGWPRRTTSRRHGVPCCVNTFSREWRRSPQAVSKRFSRRSCGRSCPNSPTPA